MDILKYFFFLVLGIILYILLNGNDGFSVGIRLVRYFDSESENYYYYNTDTGLSTWEYPDPTSRTSIYPGSLDGPSPPLPSTPAPEPIGDVGGGGASAEGIDAGVGGGGVCSAGFFSKILYGSKKLDEGSLQRLQICLTRSSIISDLTRSLTDGGFLYTSERPNFAQIFDSIPRLTADALPFITDSRGRDFLMQHGHNATLREQNQIKDLCIQISPDETYATLRVVDPAGSSKPYGEQTRYIVYSDTEVYLFKDMRDDSVKNEIINSIVGEILDISPSILNYMRFTLRNTQVTNTQVTTHCFVHKKLTPMQRYPGELAIERHTELIDRSSPYGHHGDHVNIFHNTLIDTATNKLYFIDMIDFEFSSRYYLIT
jgi:hypothetical protein